MKDILIKDIEESSRTHLTQTISLIPFDLISDSFAMYPGKCVFEQPGVNAPKLLRKYLTGLLSINISIYLELQTKQLFY